MNKKLIFFLLALFPLIVSAQRLTASQEITDCGQILYNKPLKVSFDLTNNSQTPVNIKEVKVNCGCTSVEYPKWPIKGGEKFTVNVTYDARQLGHFDKEVGIYCDNDNNPMILTMRGVVVEKIIDFKGNFAFSIDGIKADKNNIEFDNVNVGEYPVETIHIMNSKTESIEPQIMHLPPYLSARISPTRIVPGHTGEITLRLDSKKVHDYGLTQTNIYLGKFPGDKVSATKEISVSTMLLHDFEEMTKEQMAIAPKMVLSDSILNLGNFNGKKKMKGTIEIENKGKSVLDISTLQMFTAGLEVALSDSKIEPGGKASLKITAISKNLKKARSLPRILMITNDPGHSKVVIPVIVGWSLKDIK